MRNDAEFNQLTRVNIYAKKKLLRLDNNLIKLMSLKNGDCVLFRLNKKEKRITIEREFISEDEKKENKTWKIRDDRYICSNQICELLTEVLEINDIELKKGYYYLGYKKLNKGRFQFKKISK